MLPRILRIFWNNQKYILQKNLPNAINTTRLYSDTASFETNPYSLHKLKSSPSIKLTVNKNDALKYYEQMFVVRRMETTAANLYKEKVIRGFCHLYSGQEAICVGMKASLRPEDAVITAYRAHGWTYIMGSTILEVLAELTGRKSGCARGKGGSMHMYGKNFYGGNGIVGAQGPLGTGIAFAQQYKGNGAICVTLYGDGAANQGQIFEAFNMAKLWSLPVVYVCENNKYAMGTSVSRGAANNLFYTRGDYIPGIRADGMDVLAVKEVTKYGIEHCVAGNGPIILEFMTYRYHGHSMSDPGTSYRSRDEISEVRQTRDPITSFRDKILKANLATLDEIKHIEEKVKKEIDEAANKAKTDPEIPLEELTADVCALNLQGKIRNNLPWNSAEHKRIGTAINLK